ncbi:MAG: helix-turn-helix transcriptional regulator [Bacillota bacterium]|nr:helix-turn-helix transcriptional regulator [Bacillota bacterium]
MTLHLKEIRQSQGFSIVKLSKATGIHRRTIEDIEKRGDCLLSTAYKLAKFFNVSLDEFYHE